MEQNFVMMGIQLIMMDAPVVQLTMDSTVLGLLQTLAIIIVEMVYLQAMNNAMMETEESVETAVALFVQSNLCMFVHQQIIVFAIHVEITFETEPNNVMMETHYLEMDAVLLAQ